MEIRSSNIFDKWHDALRDVKHRVRIDRRIKKAARGEYGDVKPVGEGVSELRFHFGPGYRVYFTERHGIIFFLLAGGDNKTQRRDVELAKEIARSI